MRFIGPGTVIVRDSKNEKVCDCIFDDHVDIYTDKDADLYKCKDCVYKCNDDDVISKLFDKIYQHKNGYVMFLDAKKYGLPSQCSKEIKLLALDVYDKYLRIFTRTIDDDDIKIIYDVVNGDEIALENICNFVPNNKNIAIPFHTSNEYNMKGAIMQRIIDCIHVINNSKLCEDNFQLEMDGITIKFLKDEISVCEEHLNYDILTYVNNDLRNKLCNIILKNGINFFFDISHAVFVELPGYKFSVVK